MQAAEGERQVGLEMAEGREDRAAAKATMAEERAAGAASRSERGLDLQERRLNRMESEDKERQASDKAFVAFKKRVRADAAKGDATAVLLADDPNKMMDAFSDEQEQLEQAFNLRKNPAAAQRIQLATEESIGRAEAGARARSQQQAAPIASTPAGVGVMQKQIQEWMIKDPSGDSWPDEVARAYLASKNAPVR